MAKLVVISPDGAQKDTLLRAINTLGRHPDQHVQILDRVVSKEHALITFVDGGYWLQDMGSRNGTYVNGERIPGRTRLNDGDTITLGSTRCVFVEGDRLPEAGRPMKQVTINPAFNHETAIRARLQGDDARQPEFVPEAHDSLESQRPRRLRESCASRSRPTRTIGSVLDIDVLLRKILDKAFEFTTADRGVILLLDESGDPVPRAVKHRKGGRRGQSSSRRPSSTRSSNNHHAVLSSDATMDSRFGGSHSIIMQGIRSTMCVPLLFRDELLGMIHLDTRIATGVFTEKDLQILTVFAHQAAVKIAVARLAKRAEADAVARNNLSRLLSPNLVEEVVKGAIAMEKGGELRQATVFLLGHPRFHVHE
jgi:adenylate cyclase